MPNYLYKATDATGRWLTGEVSGASLDEATEQLRQLGLTVEGLHEAEAAPEPRKATASRAELAELVGQLASMTRSGLPLPSGLRAAALEVESASLRSIFLEIADLVESGGDLAGALENSSRRFPEDLRGLIAAGARSGRLAEMLGQYVRSSNLGSELRRMFWLRLTYPAVTLFGVVALVGFLCSLSLRAVETLNTVMNDFGVDRSNFARAMIALTGFIHAYGVWILAAILATPVIVWAILRVAVGPARRRRIFCSIPVIGPILRFTALAEFCHLLAMLIEAGTPLPEAFALAGQGVRDADLAEACGRMGRAVGEGEPFALALIHWPSIPAGLGQLLRWSEDRGELPGSLHLAGDMFESRSRSQSSYASNVLGMALLLLVLWWVGFAIAAIYLPMFSMIQLISKLSG